MKKRCISMKQVYCIVAAMMGPMLIATPSTAENVVFLLAGQSNMLGVGGTGWGDAPLSDPYNTPQTAVKFWNNSNNGWVNLQEGFGYDSKGFGPEVTFGYTLHNTILPGDNIYLVKYAVGATSLAADWNPMGSGACYTTFKSRANAAMQNLTAAGLSPKLGGMIWMQGETDACFSSYASMYAINLEKFVTKVRTDFAAPSMPFVLGRITTAYDTTPPGGGNFVRTAQTSVPSMLEHVSWINTDDLEINPTQPGHYGTQGQIDLGIRFADQFAVPEPSAFVLAITAVLIMAGYGWRQRRSLGAKERFSNMNKGYPTHVS